VTPYKEPLASSYPQASNRIAVESVDPPFMPSDNCPSGRRCRVSDSAFATLDTGITAKRGAILIPDPASSQALKIKQTSFLSLSGQYLMKIGRTTGWSGGVISDTCVDINVKDSNRTLRG